VVGDQLVELDVEHRRDRDRSRDHHDAERALDDERMARASHPIEQPPAA
jgi:hypothetical protein